MSDEFSKELCKKEHKNVDEKISHHGGWLKDHENKIDVLEKSDAKNTTKIDNLCSQIAGLTKAIWGLVIALLTTFAGFFIWYVQNK